MAVLWILDCARGKAMAARSADVRALKQEGLGTSAIAKTLGIGRASVYREFSEPTAEA